MLVVIILAARWVVRRFASSSLPTTRLGVGGVALGFLLVAELTMVLWLRSLMMGEYVASRDPVAGTVYLVMLGVFAVMPLLVARRSAAVKRPCHCGTDSTCWIIRVSI
jgi:hypothetical protein